MSALHEPRAALLRWYDAEARDLPWRRTRDPYAIWVSEVMLQQTRVETVIPYYQRFLARFPTAQVLADAPLDDVLAHWSGLGYYRRARLLHQGAQALVAEHAGLMPRDAAARLGLPGVGRYTAGAIGSIAFDLPEPIVDGNVARVLSRVHLIDSPLGERRTEQRLWEEASRLALGERPGALNQALMELGARVCLPVSARCGVCPIRAHCAAHRTQRVQELPVPAPKKAPKPVSLVALVARSAEGRVWLVRNEGSLFGGLWGCPLLEGAGMAQARQLAEQHGLRGTPLRARGTVSHVLTHRALTLQVFELMAAQGPQQLQLRDVHERELSTLGIATLTRKILESARGPTAGKKRARAQSKRASNEAPTQSKKKARTESVESNEPPTDESRASNEAPTQSKKRARTESNGAHPRALRATRPSRSSSSARSE